MNDEKKSFVLASREDGVPGPVLTGVQAVGRLGGVLFELALRQTYRNETRRVLEVVYTFPLPHQAVLLGFATELNGQRKEGAIVARREAERQYEDALTEGDAPVMLEASAEGLHTANIGNLKPGDEIVLEARFAQVLVFEQGRLRLAIPTTVAPRYGRAERAGLQAQQVPQASLTVEYPLSLSVTIAGSMGAAAVACPTHAMTRTPGEGGLRLDLAPGAWLDRDVVLEITPRDPRPCLLVQAHDAVSTTAPHVVMAALQPPPAARRKGLALKLLVDCSGSMGGDSIGSARRALHGVVHQLAAGDQVSLSRFGSTVEHVLPPGPCTGPRQKRLEAAIDGIDADLGGTEMEAALQAVFALPVETSAGSADVLLITDGEIWEAQQMAAAARAGGHRVFAIGVGAAPAEGVLRGLAEATGGACEFATPGEALEEAARRMLDRVRQQPWRGVCIEWGAHPVWQSALPASVFAGDTVLAFAGFAQAPGNAAPVRLKANGPDGQPMELARGEADAPCPGDSLARLAAARRLAEVDETAARAMAVSYQLMSPHTNCVLVHERADAEEAQEEAELHRVGAMLAAGWGATSTLRMSRAVQPVHEADVLFSLPSVWRSARTRAVARVGSQPSNLFGAMEIPAFLRHEPAPAAATLREVAAAVVKHLQKFGTIDGVAGACAWLQLHPQVTAAIRQLEDSGLNEADAWLLLAWWVVTRPRGWRNPSAKDECSRLVDQMGPERVDAAMQIHKAGLGHFSVDAWIDARAERLQRATLGATR